MQKINTMLSKEKNVDNQILISVRKITYDAP